MVDCQRRHQDRLEAIESELSSVRIEYDEAREREQTLEGSVATQVQRRKVGVLLLVVVCTCLASPIKWHYLGIC